MGDKWQYCDERKGEWSLKITKWGCWGLERLGSSVTSCYHSLSEVKSLKSRVTFVTFPFVKDSQQSLHPSSRK